MSASDCRLRARSGLNGHWGEAVLTTFVAHLMGATIISYSSGVSTASSMKAKFDPQQRSQVFQSLTHAFGNGTEAVVQFVMVVSLIFAIISLIFGGAANLGLVEYNKNLQLGYVAKIDDLFSRFHDFANAFFTNVIVDIVVFLFSMLFVIPGIIAGYAYSMTFFVLHDRPDMKPTEAMHTSRLLMRGHKMDLFLLELSFLGWAILSVLTLGIGFLFLHPYWVQAKTVFYLDITGQGAMDR
ncbi:MAG: DUF975 family protein [Acutalibacteraceae bacterium]|nr:DUF975 family protein [Acutalibacteraceae bacterium]